MRVRRCAILGLLGVAVRAVPFDIETGFGSGIEATGVSFASCDCRDDEEIEGEGVGCTGRAVGTSSCPFIVVGDGVLVQVEARVGHWTSVLPHPPRKNSEGLTATEVM